MLARGRAPHTWPSARTHARTFTPLSFLGRARGRFMVHARGCRCNRRCCRWRLCQREYVFRFGAVHHVTNCRQADVHSTLGTLGSGRPGICMCVCVCVEMRAMRVCAAKRAIITCKYARVLRQNSINMYVDPVRCCGAAAILHSNQFAARFRR